MSTGLWRRLLQAIAAWRDDAERDRTEDDDGAAVVALVDADRLTDESRTDVDGSPSPSDLAVVTHTTDLVAVRVVRLAQNTVEGPR